MNARRESVVYLTMTGAEHQRLVSVLNDFRDDLEAKLVDSTPDYRNKLDALLDGLTAVSE